MRRRRKQRTLPPLWDGGRAEDTGTHITGHRDGDGYRQTRWRGKPSSTELVLIRHGVSAPVKPGTTDHSEQPVDEHGQSDPSLSRTGVTQAVATGGRLAALPWHAIYVTNLQRTHQTAAPLCHATGIEPVVEPRLREAHMGDWEHGLIRERAAHDDPAYWRIYAERDWAAIPGGEPYLHLAARCRAAVDDIADAHPGQLVAVFSHNAAIAATLESVTGAPPFTFEGIDNCGISQIVRTDGVWQIRSYNDTTHLSATLHHLPV